MRLGGWGSFPLHETRLSAPRSEAALRERVAEGGLIARGNGRAYGDSAVGGRTVQMRHLDRMLAFDPQAGRLVAEAGLKAHGRKFTLYTLMGLVTTAIFWGSETLFWIVWRTDAMRELGAVLGLAVGYMVKYNLDRRYVFGGPPGLAA